MKTRRKINQTRFRFTCALLFAVGIGSAIVTHTAQNAVIESYLRSSDFDLADIYKSGSAIATLGAMAAVVSLVLMTRERVNRLVKVQAVALLDEALGRNEMPVEYRAAIAWVIQDLQRKEVQ